MVVALGLKAREVYTQSLVSFLKVLFDESNYEVSNLSSEYLEV